MDPARRRVRHFKRRINMLTCKQVIEFKQINIESGAELY